MRVLVCGGRDYHDQERLFGVLDRFHAKHGIEWIIHGAYRGADTLARLWAETRHIPDDAYPPDWKKHGKAAGPIRNQQMIDLGMPDVVIAFPGDTGTADMVSRAKTARVPVIQLRNPVLCLECAILSLPKRDRPPSWKWEGCAQPIVCEGNAPKGAL